MQDSLTLAPVDTQAPGPFPRALAGCFPPRREVLAFPGVALTHTRKSAPQATIILNTAVSVPSSCQRCGACCLRGGPALHAQDLPLFDEGGPLSLEHVLTLRVGEIAFDQPKDRLLPLGEEMLKLRGQSGTWTCQFYHRAAKACGLYENRPAECRALACRDIAPLAAMYETDRLTRADLLPAGHPVLEILAQHEELVPASGLLALSKALAAGGEAKQDAAEQLVRMFLADGLFRANLERHAGIGPEFHDFFFGREAKTLFAAAGIILSEDVHGQPRVSPDPLWRTPV